uniref:DUF7054 domain-containing protein n=1 Tax=Nelumbo nucifera TaxID=4432 RepID=A0A822Y8F4_NELNU|nr:TPA_asm: hypothetical protein HUJ06_030175 [Nelumbo nucifera]
MPTSSKNHRRGHEDKVVKMGKLTEKSSSFHGRSNLIPPQLLRPKTDPDLLSGRKFTVTAQETAPAKLTKLLLNVTIQRSLGAIQVVISPESTVWVEKRS